MSYSISLAIKETPKENMMDFINEFKQKMLKPENAQKEIELNYIYCPYIRSTYFMEEKCKGCKKATGRKRERNGETKRTACNQR